MPGTNISSCVWPMLADDVLGRTGQKPLPTGCLAPYSPGTIFIAQDGSGAQSYMGGGGRFASGWQERGEVRFF